MCALVRWAVPCVHYYTEWRLLWHGYDDAKLALNSRASARMKDPAVVFLLALWVYQSAIYTICHNSGETSSLRIAKEHSVTW